MQHTYLRYECADAFGLITSSASSKAPQSNSILAFGSASRQRPILLTTAGSVCMGFHLRTTEATIKIGHREELSGGVGTGRALNSDLLVCLDVSIQDHDNSCKVATGWVDGAVRVFDVSAEEMHSEGGSGLVQSLLQESVGQDDFIMREPLVLNGHSGSPVRSIAFDRNDASRLASGSSDGAVVLWDVVAESGLYRLLGHKGGITDMSFVKIDAAFLDMLITSSLDGLVKVWDLKGQCCIQTIPIHRGEVWCAALQHISGSNPLSVGDVNPTDDDRIRLITGSSDGQARVWDVRIPRRYSEKKDGKDKDDDWTPLAENYKSVDDVCHYMGILSPPPNVSSSAERIASIHFHPNGKYVGVLRANSKDVDVYLIRTVQESFKKKQRRLRRRKEKLKQSDSIQDREAKGQKRGMLDDPGTEDEKAEGIERSSLDRELSPEQIKASDEFEYFGTARASHKVKSFIFVPYKEQGGGIRVVCSLSTNALEVHALARKVTV